MGGAAQYIYQNPPAKKYQEMPAEYIQGIIGNENYSLYVITPEDNSNYYATEYIYALDKIRGISHDFNTDFRGEVYNSFNNNSEYLFLICRDFNDASDLKAKCLDFFKGTFKTGSQSLSKKMLNLKIYTFIREADG